ncbi:MAG: hypothetical protein KAS23_04640 [Anaerohalosphaera sp.]|nr:hypothetical protein [Anaerohalosphaera sp.]
MLKSLNTKLMIAALMICCMTAASFAVTSKISRQASAADLLKGETENIIIDSDGTMRLARKFSEIDLGDLSKSVWTINAMTTDIDLNVYLGTSPNGRIIKYSSGKSEVIYPTAPQAATEEELFTNEHVFAIATDPAGRIIAGVSGEKSRLIAYDKGTFTTLYESDKTLYILAIAFDNKGSIYLGTGPEGIVYKLNADGSDLQVVYDSKDNNILSLAVNADGFVFAGADKRGIIYKINPVTKTAAVLFDSDQAEITSLLLDGRGNLFAAATSAEAAAAKSKLSSIAATAEPGRPDNESADQKETSDDESKNLKTPNTKTNPASQGPSQQQQPKGKMPKTAGHIYRIDPRGYVTDVFSGMAVFFAMEMQNNELLLGTGNNAELIAVNPVTERAYIPYTDKTASQITAVRTVGNDAYLAVSNPAKLIKLSKTLFAEGTYTSDLIDAGQPARWGKLQLDASIPDACTISLQAHSGNVADPNDPSFSPWTNPVELSSPTQLICPLGRYCQYRLNISTDQANKTPIIREIAIAHVVDNIAPKVAKLAADRVKGKPGIFGINCAVSDDNKDTLTFTYQFRKLGRDRWITIKEDHPQPKLEWNTRTVEDGRYEVRVTASDAKSNTPATAMTGARISNAFIVDNTAPAIEKSNVKTDKNSATLTLTINDEFTVIGRIRYTVDSNEDWSSTLPDDMVYDTTNEDFTITVEDIETGEHIIAVELNDDLGNTAYKTFDVEIKE